MSIPTVQALPEVPNTNDSQFETKAVALFNAIKNNLVSEFNASITALNSIALENLTVAQVSTTANAVKDKIYLVDTSSGSFTLNLPASPNSGDRLYVLDQKNSFYTYNLTIGRNSENINGSASNYTANKNGSFITLVYYSGYGWTLIEDKVFSLVSGNAFFDGNVGIGNTNPLYPLVVKGVSSGYAIAVQKSDGSSNYSGIFEDSSGNHELYLKSNANNTNVFLNTSGDSYLNGGNIGVGTDSPVSIFNISQDSPTVSLTIDNTRDFSNSNITRIASRIKDSSGVLQSFGYIDIRSIDSSSSSKDTQFLIRGYNNNNFETFMSLESGNVGIGTSSPYDKFTVEDDNNAGVVIGLNSTGTNGSHWRLLSTADLSSIGSGKLGIRDETGGAYRLVIDGSGNVGIGTSSPSAKLDVNGPIKCKSYTVATVPSASSSGAGAQIYVTDETGGAIICFSDGTNWRRVSDRAIIS